MRENISGKSIDFSMLKDLKKQKTKQPSVFVLISLFRVSDSFLQIPEKSFQEGACQTYPYNSSSLNSFLFRL